ncbi:hypothetical protein [Pontibacter arcticus]|nr:hypothetical protein [Pontibacter arcticus]
MQTKEVVTYYLPIDLYFSASEPGFVTRDTSRKSGQSIIPVLLLA